MVSVNEKDYLHKGYRQVAGEVTFITTHAPAHRQEPSVKTKKSPKKKKQSPAAAAGFISQFYDEPRNLRKHSAGNYNDDTFDEEEPRASRPRLNEEELIEIQDIDMSRLEKENAKLKAMRKSYEKYFVPTWMKSRNCESKMRVSKGRHFEMSVMSPIPDGS
jgi:hypothetical protein